MASTWISYYLACLLYPVPDPPARRQKELKIICLGLPRSGTESLNNALRILGYDDVDHGFRWWAKYPHFGKLWMRLRLALQEGRLLDPPTLRREYFDRLLYDCEATTDIPSVWFAHELMAAYPQAKVILNRRQDVKAWKASFRGSVLPMLRGWDWYVWSFFDRDLFWSLWLSRSQHGRISLGPGDFEQHAEATYVGHFERLEAVLREQGRLYLDWSVEDGWAPLCQLLDRPIPDSEFPRGNTAVEFMPKAMIAGQKRMRNAKRNAMILAVAFAALSGCSVYWLVRR
ncbi:Hypothetical predicted protein [Lecanosticta acicola]|uniref:P-loop containing nucleoside triphosphate hydrolase protein n=1 Tax=Lecanosticta acicola TaxID=111012 RepID=A0AAI9ECL4_9PEZI|nr:Hypothetical predicted protein [Lecanosticta acicola]